MGTLVVKQLEWTRKLLRSDPVYPFFSVTQVSRVHQPPQELSRIVPRQPEESRRSVEDAGADFYNP
jgi:hypothetical protein